MYLTAGIIEFFRTGYTALSLKIGTVLAGLLTLPYLYLLGKEFGHKRIGLFALLFAGMAYWPNVISRVGLRFPLYPLFVAPVLYYLIRGLRTSKRNDFILAGLFLGIGLHGYSPIRILPIIILIVIAVYLLHSQARGKRLQAISGLLVLALISLIVFLPLLRFAIEYPSLFNLRALSRLGTIERPLPGPALLIFLKNLWNASIMYFWSDGQVWVH
jgi:4-amino-4-deoxy-L-arabinose transferase-like glycosyltransferase